MGQRCITDVILKNEGLMVKTCQNINVHEVNKYKLSPTWMFRDT